MSNLFDYSRKFFLYLFVALEVAYVISASRHLHGIYFCLSAEPGYETSRRVGSAAVCDGIGYAGCIFGFVEVETSAAPVTLRFGRFLFHIKYSVSFEFEDSAFAQACFFRLVVAHYTGCLF